MLEGPGGYLFLWEQRTDRNRPLGPGLEDTGSRQTQVDVPFVSGLDQVVQNRITEDGPPSTVVGRGALDPGVLGIDPRGRHRRRRAPVVWPDFEAVLDEFRQGGAAAAEQSQTE